MLPGFGRPGAMHIAPQVLGGFFAGPHPGGFQRAVLQHSELFPLFLRHRFPVGQPHVWTSPLSESYTQKAIVCLGTSMPTNSGDEKIEVEAFIVVETMGRNKRKLKRNHSVPAYYIIVSVRKYHIA